MSRTPAQKLKALYDNQRAERLGCPQKLPRKGRKKKWRLEYEAMIREQEIAAAWSNAHEYVLTSAYERHLQEALTMRVAPCPRLDELDTWSNQ